MIHEKEGGLPSLRINYITSEPVVSEWICLEHSGFARRRAEDWWRMSGLPGVAPESAAEAVAIIKSEHWCPPAIQVRREGKYWRVLSFELPEVRV